MALAQPDQVECGATLLLPKGRYVVCWLCRANRRQGVECGFKV